MTVSREQESSVRRSVRQLGRFVHKPQTSPAAGLRAQFLKGLSTRAGDCIADDSGGLAAAEHWNIRFELLTTAKPGLDAGEASPSPLGWANQQAAAERLTAIQLANDAISKQLCSFSPGPFCFTN